MGRLQNGFRFCLSGFMVLLSFHSVSWTQQTDLPSSNSSIALKNATIISMAKPGSFVGTIVIKDGRIHAVGSDPVIPDGARQFDVSGFTVVPGLIDSRSVLWLTEAAIKESSSKGSLDIVDGIDAWQDNSVEVAAQGVTSVYIQPNQSGSLGGFGAVLSVIPTGIDRQLIVKDQVGLQAAIGITGERSTDRYAQYQKLKTAIENIKTGKDLESSSASTRTSASAGGSRPGPRPVPTTRGRFQRPAARITEVTPPDRAKEVLKQVIDRKVPLRIEVHHSDAIDWVCSLAREAGVRVVVDGASQAGDPTHCFIDNGVPVVVGPLVELQDPPPYRKNAQFDWLADYDRQGGQWALGSFASHPRGSRLLRMQAAAAVALGVSPQSALRAMTIYPARLLGVSDEIGSIEVGKRADLAVFAGSPLDPSAATRLVICNGQIVHQSEARPSERFAGAKIKLPDQWPAEFAIKSSRMMRGGAFMPGKLIVRNGKIAEFNGALDEHGELPMFDLGDAVVTPGLVVAHSNLGQESSLNHDAESDLTFARAVDAFDPTSEGAEQMLQGGFVNVGFAPKSSILSPGMMGQVKLGAPNGVVDSTIANKFVISKSSRDAERFPASLTGQIQVLQAMFNGKIPDTRLYVSSSVKRSLMAEKQSAIRQILSGAHPILLKADTPLEIDTALRFAIENHLQGSLISSGRIGQHIPLLKQSGFRWIVPPANGAEYETYFNELSRAAAEGVSLCFAGDTPWQVRITAALCHSAGLSTTQALLGLTSEGAKSVGMQPGTAAFGVGNDADFVIWSDSPLNLAAVPLEVFVSGKPIAKP